jgi:hypothetical protein
MPAHIPFDPASHHGTVPVPTCCLYMLLLQNRLFNPVVAAKRASTGPGSCRICRRAPEVGRYPFPLHVLSAGRSNRRPWLVARAPPAHRRSIVCPLRPAPSAQNASKSHLPGGQTPRRAFRWTDGQPCPPCTPTPASEAGTARPSSRGPPGSFGGRCPTAQPSVTSTTRTSPGPCTPVTSTPSMSAVLLGPVIRLRAAGNSGRPLKSSK